MKNIFSGVIAILLFLVIPLSCKSVREEPKKEKTDPPQAILQEHKLTPRQFKNYTYVQTDCYHPDTLYSIDFGATVNSVVIRPYSKNVPVEKEGTRIKFKLPQAGHYIAYINNFKIIVFAETPETVPSGVDVVNVVAYTGCDNQGRINETAKIQDAIDRIGGTAKTLLFPPGTYLTGQLRIVSKSGVKIHLQRGATLLADTTQTALTTYSTTDIFGSPGTSHIAGKTRWTESRAFILIDNSRDIEITGYGTLDGRGRAARRNAVVANGSESAGRYRNLLITRSENVRIDGIVSADPGTWNTHIILCKNVVCQNMKVVNELDYAPVPGNLNNIDHNNVNTDGFDPDASENVTIRNCFAYCSDDNIAVKTSEYCGLLGDLDGVTVEGCTFLTQKSSLKVGTETGGKQMKNIVFRNNVVVEADRALALYCYDGAEMSGVRYENNIVESNYPDRDKTVVLFEVKPRQDGSLVGKAAIEVADTDVRAAFPNKSRITYSNVGALNAGGTGNDLRVSFRNFMIAGNRITASNSGNTFTLSGNPLIIFP